MGRAGESNAVSLQINLCVETGTLKISASRHDDNWCTFDITILVEHVQAYACVLDCFDLWRSFGHDMQLFPENATSRISFEAGADNPSDTFIKLEAYCYDMQGHSALRIYIDNRRDDPYRRRFEFSIPSEASSINQLGRLLANWQAEDNSQILWQAQTS